MLIAIPRDDNTLVNCGLVNCEPWSVLKISGWLTDNADSNALTQKPTSKLFDNSHDRTFRLNQSITATRYKNPRANGTYVMSVLQTWSGRSIVTPRNKYGKTRCSGEASDRRGPGWIASKPMICISRRTRFTFT